MGSEISYFTWFHDTQKNGNKRIFNTLNDDIFMCHVRAATKGAINNQNAHPFDVKSIVGAHNGTLRDKKYEHKTKTDSELFFEDVETRGLKEVIESLHPDSAYAVTIYNKNNGTITFAKNDQRPLHFTYNTTRKVMYWASEKMMLEFILKRVEINYGLIYRFTDNRIYTLDPSDIQAAQMPRWTSIVDVTAPKKEEPKKEEEQKLPLITHQTKERENLNNVLLNKDNDNVVPLNLNLRNRQKGKKKLLEHCVYCQRDMDPLDQYLGTMMDEGLYICKTCNDINEEVAKEHMEKHSPLHHNKGIMH